MIFSIFMIISLIRIFKVSPGTQVMTVSHHFTTVSVCIILKNYPHVKVLDTECSDQTSCLTQNRYNHTSHFINLKYKDKPLNISILQFSIFSSTW